MPLDSCTPHDGDRGAIDRRRFLRDGLLGIGGALFLSLTGAVEAQQRTMQSGFRRLLWLQMGQS